MHTFKVISFLLESQQYKTDYIQATDSVHAKKIVLSMYPNSCVSFHYVGLHVTND